LVLDRRRCPRPDRADANGRECAGPDHLIETMVRGIPNVNEIPDRGDRRLDR
jgi:hypothetical protein